MDKRTDNNGHEEKSPTASSAERFFQWRLTDKDKRFLRAMNISPE